MEEVIIGWAWGEKRGRMGWVGGERMEDWIGWGSLKIGKAGVASAPR